MTVRRLDPHPDPDVDLFDALRPPAGMWLRLDFVTSLDGAAVDEAGRSGGLGGEGDRQVFRMLRAHADAIVVGAGTVRAERYGPHRMAAELAGRRAGTGRCEPAPIVVVSRSLRLDLASPLFAEAVAPTVVLTCETASADRRRAVVEAGGEVVVAGMDAVDLAEGLALLRARGLASIVCEGGPRLAAELVDAALVDELCLTVAPVLVGRGGPRLVPALAGRAPFALTRVLESGGELYLGYAARRSDAATQARVPG